jgi:hypothetical protein
MFVLTRHLMVLGSACFLLPIGIASASAQPSDASRSIALFEQAGKVLQHPRCLNCHPAGDRPTQTDRMTAHRPMVVRGADGHGAAGMPCNACHQAANYDELGVPGHPQWHLAPASMAWAGRSLGEICRQIKDPARKHRSQHGGTAAPYERGFVGRLGVGAGRQAHASARHASRVRCTDASLGREQCGLPGGMKGRP